jgi:hypothetical protein
MAANGDIALPFDASNLAVVALRSRWDTGDGFLCLSGYRIVVLTPTVPGSIEMGFELTHAGGDGLNRQNYWLACQSGHVQIGSHSGSAVQP